MTPFRIKLNHDTVELIRKEMESIPEKYHKQFNSMHEGLSILREEYLELEKEVFFGEKPLRRQIQQSGASIHEGVSEDDINKAVERVHKTRVKQEAIQVAAMAIRIIQELT